MSNLMSIDNVLAFGFGLYTVRQFMLVAAAERGRKRDLVRRRFQGNHEFHISVLVPFLSVADVQPLYGLIQALESQTYPATRVSIHVVCTPDTAPLVEVLSQKPQIRLLICPSPDVSTSSDDAKALAWLVDRCIAQGGSGWMVFLRPTDLIKNDFFQNIVARGYDSFVLQGYTALKQRPQSWIERVWALDQRLRNRVDNAGRYHLSGSTRLMPTGWAIKREVLEMVPIAHGADLESLAYTIQLNHHQFKVNWAPTVVTYEALVGDIRKMTHNTLEAAQTQCGLLLSEGPRLFLQGLINLDVSRLEQAVSLTLPSASWVTLAMVLLSLGNAVHLWDLPGRTLTWGLTTLALLVVSALGLLVARCQAPDIVTALFFKPAVMLAQLVMAPVVLVQRIMQGLNQKAQQRHGHTLARYRTASPALPASGFWEHDADEEDSLDTEWYSEPLPNASAELNLPQHADYSQPPPRPIPVPEEAMPFSSVDERPLPQPTLMPAPEPEPSYQASMQSMALQPKEQVISVPILYGTKQVQCMLKVHTDYGNDGVERYTVTMAYKQFAFSSATYRILDQAFYELHAKLQSRGLTIITCGTCGQFYNPTADVPGALRTTGVCLFGKQGKDVNLQTDAVSVISQACPYHCDITQRESIVRQWRNSLSMAALEA